MSRYTDKKGYQNYQERAVEFNVGDKVIPYGADFETAGRVVQVFPAIGRIDVQFPHGYASYPVEDVSILKEKSTPTVVPKNNTVPGGVGTVSVPGGPYARSSTPDAVASRVASRTIKKALYWADLDRKYRASKEEIETGSFKCPNCKTEVMRPTIYKRESGSSEKLLGCTNCLFLIKRINIIT